MCEPGDGNHPDTPLHHDLCLQTMVRMSAGGNVRSFIPPPPLPPSLPPFLPPYHRVALVPFCIALVGGDGLVSSSLQALSQSKCSSGKLRFPIIPLGTYTYVHTYIHTYIHTYVRTDVRTYGHTYIHTYIHTLN